MNPKLHITRYSNLRKPRAILSTLITAAAAILTAEHVEGQDTFTWDAGGADGKWQTSPLNWGGDLAPDGNDILRFAGALNTLTENDFAAYIGHRIFFDAGAATFTLSGNALTLSDFGGNAPKVENNSSGSNQIFSLAGITLDGSAGGGFAEVNPVDGNLTIISPLTLAGTTQLRVWGNKGNTVTFNGVITGGTNSFTLNQNSTAVFNAANVYTGDSFVNAGTLQISEGASVSGGVFRLGDTSGAANSRLRLADATGGAVHTNALNSRAGASGTRTIEHLNSAGTNTLTGAISVDASLISSSTTGGTVAYTGAVTLSNNSNITLNGNGNSFFTNSITQGAASLGSITKNGNGTLVLSGANVFGSAATSNTILTVNGGRVEVLSGGGLGNASNLNNGKIVVANGAQVDFNGQALTGGGKSFIISGAGPDGRGALVNDYAERGADSIISNVTLTGHATIGGTRRIDIGTGTGGVASGYFFDGGGFNLTSEATTNFNIRGTISNLPNMIINKGFTQTEGFDWPAATTITVNSKAHLGAWASTTRVAAGNVILNRGNIGAQSNTAGTFFVIGTAGSSTVQVNGEGRINPNTVEFNDWSGIASQNAIRVDGALTGSGRLYTHYYGALNNGTTVVLNSNNPGFSGDVVVGAGTVASVLQLGTGGTVGDLGAAPSVAFTATTNTVPGQLLINRSDALFINQTLTGPGSVLIQGGATVTLNGANTTGGSQTTGTITTMVRQGTLILGGANVLSPRSNLEVGSATGPTIGQVRLNGFSPTVERLDDAGTAASTNNRIVNGSSTYATLTFNIQNAGPVFGDFAGQLGHTSATADENNFGITKLGANDWTLAGNSHGYTGLTTIKAGRFRLGANATFGNAVLGATGTQSNGTVVEPGGSLDFQGVAGFTSGVGNEVLIISGRGNGYTTNGFENGALVNAGTANATTAANNVLLAGNASIGRNGNAVSAGTDWDIRAINSSSVLMLNGFALTKVGRNTVSLADVVDGTGDGDVIVRQGTLNIEHGSVLDGAGTVRVLHGANLALNDTNSSLGYSVPTSPVSITKNIVLNGSDLTNTNGSRSLPQGISTSGDFRVYNNDAAATVTLGNIVQPVRGAGGQFGTAGSVVLTTINGAALPSGRLGAGWTAGTTPAATTFATWNGTNVQPIALTFNTTATNVNTATATDDVLNNNATVGVNNTVTADLTIGSLTNDQVFTVNNGALLRIQTGGVVFRNLSSTAFMTHAAGGPVGRITSGAANGELHFSTPIHFETTGGQNSLRLKIVDNPGAGGLFTPVTFVKHGPGGLNNFGMDASTTSAPVNSEFTGGSLLDSGRMEVTSATGFGTGPITVRDGATLSQIGGAANGTNIFNRLTLGGLGFYENGGVNGTVRYQNGAAVTVLTGNVTLQTDVRLHTANAGDIGTQAGILSGAFGLEKTGPGLLALPSAHRYTGSTTITNGSLIAFRLANGGVESSVGASSSAASNLVLNGGTLRYQAPGTSTDRNFTIDIQGGAVSNEYHTGALEMNGTATLAAGGDRTITFTGLSGGNNVFAGSIGDSNAGRTAVTKDGFGKWIFTGNHTFGGTLTVTNGGTLVVGDGGTNGTVGSGMYINMLANADIVFNRSDNVTLGQKISGLGTGESQLIWPGPGTLTLTGYEDNNSACPVVNGGTLVLAKTSNLNVHAAANFLTQNAGVVQLGGIGDDQIFNGGRYYLNSGTFDLNGRDEAIGDIAQNVGAAGGIITNSGATPSELRLGTSTSNLSVLFNFSNPGTASVIQDGVGGINVVKDGSGTSILRNNNTYSGGTRVLHGTLQIGQGTGTGSVGSGPIYVGSIDTNAATLRVDRTGTLALGQVISGPGNLAMIGEGELKLTGANSYQGLTTIRRGTLTVDLANQDNTLPQFANFLGEGGKLTIVGRPAGTSTQNFTPAGIVGGTALFQIAGADITGDNNGGNLVVGLPNSWTRNAGGSVNFATAGAGTTTFSSGIANSNGIVAGANAAYATFNGTTWASQVSSQITGLPSGSYSAAVHRDLAAGLNTIPAATSFATARLNSPGSATLDLSGGTTTLTQGGLLVTPNVGANSVTVQNGSLATTGNELFVHQHNAAGDLAITATIGGTTILTKAGAGRLILAGANASTGAIHINQGTLQIGNGATAGTWGTAAVTNDGTLVFSRSDGTYAVPIAPIGTGIISGSGRLIVTGGGVMSANATHTLTGGVTIENGALTTSNFGGNYAPLVIGNATTGANNFNVAYLPSGTTITNPVPIQIPNTGSSGTVMLGTSGGTAAYIFAGTIEVNRPLTLVAYNTDRTTFINSTTANNTTAANGISGNIGTLTIDVPALSGLTPPTAGVGVRRIDLQSDNTFTATTVNVLNGCTLQVGSGTSTIPRNQLPDNITVNLVNPSGAANGSTFQFNGEGEVIDTINGDVGTTIRSIAGGGVHMNLTVNGGTFNGSYDGGANLGMYIQKVGAGTLTLGGTADNPNGKVRMDSGTLLLNKTNSSSTVSAVAVELTQTSGLTRIIGTGGDQIRDTTVVTLHGGTIDLNGNNETVGQLQGLGGVVTNTAPLTTATLGIGSTLAAGSSVYYGSINDGAGGGVIALTKNTVNGLALAGDSNYSGTTTVSGGNFQIGIGGDTGSIGGGDINTAANTNVIIDRTGAYPLTNKITGLGRYVQNGTAVVAMSNTNTYTGSTTINGGTLIVSGSISGSAVTVNDTATLSGNGTTGAVAVAAGGTLSPGLAQGTLNTGALNMLAGSTLSIELAGTSLYDAVSVTGSLSLAGYLSASLTGAFVPDNSFQLFFIGVNDGSDPVIGTFAGLPDGGNLNIGGYVFTIDYDGDSVGGTTFGGNDIVLSIPEPASGLMLLGGLAMLLSARRRGK